MVYFDPGEALFYQHLASRSLLVQFTETFSAFPEKNTNVSQSSSVALWVNE